MKIRSWAMSDVGRKRERNEDSYLSNEEMQLFVVADGMGGHLGGEFASKLAVKTIKDVLAGMMEDPESTLIAGVNSDLDEYGLRLKYAIEVASEKIFDQAMYDSSLRGMGTTTVALLFDERKAHIANVGDSRAYVCRDGELDQVTEDHSLVGEQLRAGLINKKDIKNHKLKNIITRSVGFQEDVDIDLYQLDIKPGDRFLLCSDGLTNYIQDSEIKEFFYKYPIQEAVREWVALANARGGEDNITAVAVEVLGD